MQVTKTVQETRALIKNWKKEGKTIGLVPTMGFLHEGHASLIKRCRDVTANSARALEPISSFTRTQQRCTMIRMHL